MQSVKCIVCYLKNKWWVVGSSLDHCHLFNLFIKMLAVVGHQWLDLYQPFSKYYQLGGSRDTVVLIRGWLDTLNPKIFSLCLMYFNKYVFSIYYVWGSVQILVESCKNI